MDVWFTHFLFLIQVDNKLLASDSDDEPGTLEMLKAQVSSRIAKEDLVSHPQQEKRNGGHYYSKKITVIIGLNVYSSP